MLADVTSVVITGVVILLIVSWVLGSIGRSVEKVRGRNRCQFCGARLKRDPKGLGYSDHCSRCGRSQPWAADA